MNKKNLFQLWTNGPRFLMILLFIAAVLGKFTNPGSFYIIVNALNPPANTPEFLLSLLIITELAMIWLLTFKPDTGIICSAVLLLFFTLIIGLLHAIGIRELCGCFGDFINDEIGPAKILQNTGLALLLFSSWKARKTSS
ncbi:MAG: MauE/DoxX family redox-associated membrane protein [Balneolaceae bacterium]